MPIYEYRCTRCNVIFEEWLRHVDDAATCECPSCKGKAKRIMSNATFVLKGGGWYATEYGNRKADKADKAASSPAGSENASPACASGSSSDAPGPSPSTTT